MEIERQLREEIKQLRKRVENSFAIIVEKNKKISDLETIISTLHAEKCER